MQTLTKFGYKTPVFTSNGQIGPIEQSVESFRSNDQMVERWESPAEFCLSLRSESYNTGSGRTPLYRIYVDMCA